MFCEQCGKQISEGVKFCKYCGYNIQEPKSEKIEESVKHEHQISTNRHAGFWVRFFAYLIDGFINCIFLVILYILSPSFQDEYIIFIILYLFLTWGYFIYFEGKNGSTIGKKLLGIKIVTKELAPINYNIAFIRALGKIPSSILFLGYIAIAFDKNKLSWHDKIAKTIVIYERKKIESQELDIKKIDKKKKDIHVSTTLATVFFWIFLLIILMIASFYLAPNAESDNNQNKNINSDLVTQNTNRIIYPYELTIMRPLIEKDSTGENKCLRFGEELLPDEYLSKKEIQIRGFFETGGKLSVNGINVELEGNKFDTKIEFNFKLGENILIFKGIYPNGKEIIKECYMEYQP